MISHSLRSNSHNKFLKLYKQINDKEDSTFIFFSLPRVVDFQTTFVVKNLTQTVMTDLHTKSDCLILIKTSLNPNTDIGDH